MSCDWFEERMQDLLDQRHDPAADPRLCSHAQRCPECRLLLEIQGRLFLAFPRNILDEQEEPACSASDDDGQGMERPELGRATWRKWTSAVSSGAVILALLAIMVVGRAVQPPIVVPSTTASTATVQLVKGSADLPRGGGETEGRGSVQLAVTGPHGLGERPLVELVAQLGESISTLPGPRLDGVQELAEGIRPLADSVGSMVEALRQRWQGSRTERMQPVPDTSWIVEWGWVV